MNILVTGGAGYAGSHLAALLRRSSIAHVLYDNLSTGHKDMVAASVLVQGDVTDASMLHATFARYRPDVVVHLAALATLGACEADPAECERINVEGTRCVLEAMRAHQVRSFVFASSCAVYAPAVGMDALSEHTSPIAPASVYGKSKLAAEQLIAQYEVYGIRHAMLRIFNIAGADPIEPIGESHHPETHLLPLAIAAALGRSPMLEIYGNDYATPDGTAVRDYIHVSDVAAACVRAAHHLTDGGDSLIVNLGSGVGTSVMHMLAEVERRTGKTVPTQFRPRRQGDVAALIADNSNIKQLLGWLPALSGVDDIVKSALRWHLIPN